MVGNHDIGFHYRAHPYFIYRFEQAFNTESINLYKIKNLNFITINSVAMEGDTCDLCTQARSELQELSKEFIKCKSKNCQPIILQHFPTYRDSDNECFEKDDSKFEIYREKWEVLSKESTKLIGKSLKPKLAFSGHSHYYCRLNNSLNIEEFTVASYNWRNTEKPSFLLAKFSNSEYNVMKCNLPSENTIIIWYAVTFCILLFILIRNCRKSDARSKIC